jgi:hypothetical protein
MQNYVYLIYLFQKVELSITLLGGVNLKDYVELNGQTYKLQVGYEVGGHSYFSGERSERGYYLYVQPVSVGRDNDGNIVTESFTFFEGYKVFLKGVNRQSKKALAEAVEESAKYVDDVLNKLELERAKKVGK